MFDFYVSRSGYYNWLKPSPTKRLVENMEITENIKVIYKASHKTYGSPRITEALRRRNIFVSRPRVARLMKARRLVVRRGKDLLQQLIASIIICNGHRHLSCSLPPLCLMGGGAFHTLMAFLSDNCLVGKQPSSCI